MATPRTPDDVQDERQRASKAREAEVEHERSAQRDQRPRDNDDPGTSARQRIAKERDEEGFLERMAEERKHHDFIERTKPDDPSDHFGQLTRDNVNPDIPSAEPGKGDIVDPRSIGMEMASGAGSTQRSTTEPEFPQAQPVEGGKEGKEAPPLPDAHPDQLAARLISPNEPWGSNVGGEAAPGEGGEGSTLTLTDISPDSAPIDPNLDMVLTATGEGFTADCVILFDDEEMTTTLVNSTTLTASVPSGLEPGVVDVEVARGEELSEVLTFEWVAAAGGTRKSEKATRKPKKAEPPSKRAKKSKGRK